MLAINISENSLLLITATLPVLNKSWSTIMDMPLPDFYKSRVCPITQIRKEGNFVLCKTACKKCLKKDLTPGTKMFNKSSYHNPNAL
jgi:hypothetical protein